MDVFIHSGAWDSERYDVATENQRKLKKIKENQRKSKKKKLKKIKEKSKKMKEKLKKVKLN